MKLLPTFSNGEILRLRPSVERPVASDQPLSSLVEPEPADKQGTLATALTVFLLGSECKLRCTMCDLWKFTHLGKTPPGNIPRQIQSALNRFRDPDEVSRASNLAENPAWATAPSQVAESPRWIKLYNASNFFSPYNVPAADLPEIASLTAGFDRVVVENHPSLLNDSVSAFASSISGRLEIAMGLETIHPEILPKLNKRMTLDDFKRAVQWLGERGIDVRTFVLLRPPGLGQAEGIQWCLKSIEFADKLGVSHISLIPVRAGNGAMDQLSQAGLFEPPNTAAVESVMQHVMEFQARITVDLWDWEKLGGQCPKCSPARKQAITQANLVQQPPLAISCTSCCPARVP